MRLRKVSEALRGEAKYQALAVISFAAVATTEARCQSIAYWVPTPNQDKALEGEILVLESPSKVALNRFNLRIDL